MRRKRSILGRILAPAVILSAIAAIILIPVRANALPLKEVIEGILGTNKPSIQSTEPTLSTTTQTSQQAPAATPQALLSSADTAAAVKQVAASQAQRSTVPVHYTSNQIDASVRDELLILAAAIVAIGGAVYGMTYIASPQKVAFTPRRPLYIK